MALITLLMCGDVMTGRGVDQVLPYPSHPYLYEPYMGSAKGYVALAERANGSIQQPVSYEYIWGDALDIWAQIAPDVRLINLETSITRSDDYWRDKAVNYRMHPQNMPCLTAARVDVCALANNHVLDWGYAGLTETLTTLKHAHIKTTGAGQTLSQAKAPAIVNLQNQGRVLVFAVGSETSGIPVSWAAERHKPGVNLLPDFSDQTVQAIRAQIQSVKQSGDLVVLSIHWGRNWGYGIPQAHIQFAHQLIDEAGVDIIHGHSSHHVKGIEVYQNKLILYGCGDFINDYEGIAGYESFRSDLSLMYFTSIDSTTGELVTLQMIPTQLKRFRLHRAELADSLWLRDCLDRQGKALGTGVDLKEKDLILHWS
ncbi:MAG: CapA family protein [Cyanobacteria bacterium P01_D01_bin.44]